MTERPTRHRLVVAMGVATGLLVLLLGLLDVFLKFDGGARNTSQISDQVLQVLIRRDAVRPRVDIEPPESEPETDVAADARDLQTTAPTEAPADSRPPIDWSAQIVESVAALQREQHESQRVSDDMWRQSASIMFKPEDVFVPSAQAPVLTDFRFKPEIHVLGVGFTVGSCFIGLPLVGVPVEERSVAIRLFVCARASG